MAKQLLFIIALFIATTFATNAQCVINSSLTGQGFYPDSLTNLPGATNTAPYLTDIQVRVPADTTIFGFTVTVDDIHIDLIDGLPSGLNYSVNPVSGTIMGNSNGCIQITGVTPIGAEMGGPNSDGVYPLIINYTMHVTVPFVGAQSLPLTEDKYRIIVTNPIGLNKITLSKNEAIAYPNPASDQLTVEFMTAGNKVYSLDVYNYMGQLVSNQTGNSKDGVNKTALSTSDLANGTYIYRLRLDNTTVSKTFSVQH